jgi:hypothetical protein
MDLTAETRRGVTSKVFEFLGRHLVFRSVLGSVAKSFAKIQSLDLDTIATGPMGEAWLEFRNAAEERLVRRQFFDEDEKTITGFGYGCQREEVGCLGFSLRYPVLNHNSPQCPIKSNKVDIIICSSCKSSQFCGRQCQKLDGQSIEPDVGQCRGI